MPESIAYNVDCMEYMKDIPDKYFDISCVDPPYGGGGADNEYKGAIVGRFGGRFEKYHLGEVSSQSLNVERERERESNRPEIRATRTGGTWAAKYSRQGGVFSSDGDIRHWDYAPPQEYFDELFRVSKNCIIWGGNYFALPPTRCFLVWRKLTISENFTMAMAEYAWTSFNENAKVFEFAPQGKKGDTRFHPTQKPVELYAWIYRLFAKPGMKILDTHLGSGSSRIAAYDAGLDFVGCEIDEYYFNKQEERFAKHIAQRSIWDDDYGEAEQTGLWE